MPALSVFISVGGVAIDMRRTISRILKRLVAVATLVAVAGALAPAAAAPLDRHCAAGHESAITVTAPSGCHQAAGAPCATGGCLVAPAALLLVATVAPISVPDHAVVVPLTGHLTDLLAAGPPTPPPNR